MPLIRRTVLALFGLGFAALASVPAGAQSPSARLLRERAPAERPQLLVIGTAHLANHHGDVVNHSVPDVFEAQRQREIAAVVEALAAFKPTHIAVEMASDAQAKLDARYRDWQAGTYTLGRSEIDQFGMRLAARLGHARLHAVDWNKMPPGVIADFDYATWAEANGMAHWLKAMRAPADVRAANDFMQRHSVGQWLMHFNDPQELAATHRRYFDYAMLGNAQDSPGATWVGNWYARNLKIFANLVRLADGPQDRVLVIYGRGHAPLLREFAEQSGAFTVVDPQPLLRPAATPPQR